MHIQAQAVQASTGVLRELCPGRRERVWGFACKNFYRPRRGQLGQRRFHSLEEAMPVVSGDECRAACGIAGLSGSDLLVTLEASPCGLFIWAEHSL